MVNSHGYIRIGLVGLTSLYMYLDNMYHLYRNHRPMNKNATYPVGPMELHERALSVARTYYGEEVSHCNKPRNNAE